VKICCKTDHKSKKNCIDNIFCIQNLYNTSEGIWNIDSSDYIDHRLGMNMEKRLRKDMNCPSQLKNLGTLHTIPTPCCLNLAHNIHLGATCYLNVLMQTLYHNVLIRNAIYQMSLSNTGHSTTTHSHSSTPHNLGYQVLFNLQHVFATMDASIDVECSLLTLTGSMYNQIYSTCTKSALSIYL
jgi:hypothetical protein